MQTENIRSIFKIPFPEIAEGKVANLTIFLPNEEYIFKSEDIFSKCRNNAFIDKTLKGKVIGIINKDKLFLKK